MPLPNPVIVVPGITATYLRDQYPIPPEIVWAVIEKSYERAALHPDDLSKIASSQRVLEAQQPARVVSDQLYEIAYKELIEELRFNLREKEDQPVPVYGFGYDWRQPLELLEEELARFVEEIIERTKLMRHYHRAGYGDDPKVNLVGHSMGGMVIAGYLERFGDKKRISKVATLASPFQGSFEAVIKVTTGTANLGEDAPSSRERESARVTPALYYLIPSFTSGLTIDEAFPKHLFDPAVWQPSIVKTISEYIRLHGLAAGSQSDRDAQAETIFASMLTAARKHRRRLDRLDLSKAKLTAKDWLCIVGVDAETRVRLEIAKRGSSPNFEFRTADRANLWSEPGADAAARRQTGDGTVPFEGALPKFLPYESLVCLAPRDFGYWEVADHLALKVGGFHGILPNMDVIHRLIVRHFTGRPDKHGNTWGRLPPGIAAADWDPPFKLDVKA